MKIVLEKYPLTPLKQSIKNQLCSLKVVTVWIFSPLPQGDEREKMA
jgi:hypothetical protein